MTETQKMSNESREETLESLRTTLDAKQKRVMQLSHALPKTPEGGFTDEEAEKYLSMNKKIIEELEEMEKVHDRIEGVWQETFSRNPTALTTPLATAIRHIFRSRADAASAQLEETMPPATTHGKTVNPD